MQITINLKLVSNDALELHAKAFLEECQIQAQHMKIAEQRGMMFQAAVMEMDRRKMPRAETLRTIYKDSLTYRVLNADTMGKKSKWLIYIPDEGHWHIEYWGDDEAAARRAYLKWAKRRRLPAWSFICRA